MIEIIEKLNLYFSYPFVQYAIIASTFIALCSSLFGVILVLKRFSFIGDGLSHVAFFAMAIAAVLKLSSDMPLILIITILVAIILLCLSNNTSIKGDAAIAMFSVTSLGLGYLLMNLFATSSNLSGDVCTTLFGSTSILTLGKYEVIFSVVLSIIVILIYVFFYNKLFAITFDEDFAKAIGIKVWFYNLLISIVIAVIIVLAMNLVGSLLTSALIIFPALSSMRVFKSFKSVVISSTIFSVLCALLGIVISILIGTPVGSTIVFIDIIGFAIYVIIGKVF